MSVKEGINFCPNCGMKIDKLETSTGSGTASVCNDDILAERNVDEAESTDSLYKKVPVLAAFLSFIIPGAGQMYNEEVEKGVIYLIISIVIPIIALYLLYENENESLVITIFASLMLIIYIIFYIYIVIDAYRTARLARYIRIRF